MYSTLLSAASYVPNTPAWTPKVGIIMILCNIAIIALGRYVIQYPNEGRSLPSPQFFGGLSLPAFLATASFGHIVGTGVILGLAYLGAL
ncbi:photosystem I reaction center subunit PsaK [Pleurocapsales cyanobacterium LEGE 06147]|nr:photosystem I reaction center subunit PsaK [Pleurocapsales cyanobacterium LEGE 06147]